MRGWAIFIATLVMMLGWHLTRTVIAGGPFRWSDWLIVLMIPYLLSSSVRMVRFLESTRPVIQVSAEGIVDRRVAERLIPWSDIREMRVRRTESLVVFTTLELIVTDVRRYRSLGSLLWERDWWLGQRARCPVRIVLNIQAAGPADVLRAVEYLRPAQVKLIDPDRHAVSGRG